MPKKAEKEIIQNYSYFEKIKKNTLTTQQQKLC
jgi:hypothetical protein